MDNVPVSLAFQVGEHVFCPSDILTRKQNKNFFGNYTKTYDYYPFDAKLRDIVFDLEGIGKTPTEIAQMMLAWWIGPVWSTLHAHILADLKIMFVDNKDLNNFIKNTEASPVNGGRNLIEMAILVLGIVEESVPSKQRLVVDILGELLGAKYVSRQFRLKNPAETFYRSCIFGNHLRTLPRVPNIKNLKITEYHIKEINASYQKSLRIADLKKRQLVLLQIFLERFVKFDKDKIKQVISGLPEPSFKSFWQHCEYVKIGQLKNDLWGECYKKFSADDGCFDSDNICGFCWIMECPLEEVGKGLKCKRHEKAKGAPIIESFIQSEENQKVMPSAPPLERQVIISSAIVGLEEQLKQIPSAPPIEESQDEIARECGVCFKPFDCVLVPCGHVCCMVCSEQLKICHLCRGPIIIRQRIRF